MNKFTLKTKLILLLIFTFIIVNVIAFFVSDRNKLGRTTIALDTHIHTLQNHYKVLYNEQKRTADLAYHSTIKNEKVIKVFQDAFTIKSSQDKEKLREELYKLLSKDYEILEKRGVVQFQFVFPNNKSFLRFHNPSMHGDNLTKIRPDFQYANDKQKIVRGLFKGEISHAFRNVYPIFNKQDKHIGALEISFSSQYAQKKLIDTSNIYTHYLFHKDVFNTKELETKNSNFKYIQSLEHNDFLIGFPKEYDIKKYNRLVIKKIKGLESQIKENIKKGKQFALYTTKNISQESVYVITFVPVRNTLNQKVLAWLISYEKDAFITVTIKNTNFMRYIFFFCLIIIFYFFYKTLNQKQILQEAVELKTAELNELNESLEQRIIMEVANSKEIEGKLFHSEKMASMGEMVGNIAHQWRQPLSAISTDSTGMKMKKEYGLLSDEDFYKSCDNINKHAQYLSKTIEDFRNYIRGNREKKSFYLHKNIDSFIHIIEGSIKKENIQIINTIDKNIMLNSYENELVQCFINIFNNAKDAFLENDIDKKYIFLSAQKEQNIIKIYFKDNAKGIQEDILSKIFEPYFTTKHKTQGTGLGLHMTYTFIIEGMNGNIEVNNTAYSYENNNYTGAEFIITLPLS